MSSCDCLIVGGGPAGSSCARRLVAAGFDVVVIDKSTFPRDKICAGWITPAIVDELEIDLADFRRENVCQTITGFRTGLLGGRQIETRYDKIVSYGIRRCEFDNYLLHRAGARLVLGNAVSELRREGGRWIVNDSISAPLVVGAGGHFCPVARVVGGNSRRELTTVFAQEAEFEMTPAQVNECRVAPEVPELFFCSDLRGYAWCFRKESYLNIGMGREQDRNLPAQVAAFGESLQEWGRVPRGIEPRFHGHAYRLYGAGPRNLVADGALLIGDSAGLAFAQSGEGIRPAIESGLLAAETIVAAKGDYGRATLAGYERRLTARFGRRSPGRQSSLIPERVRSSIAARLLATRWFTRRVLIDRWFLHANQAPLPPTLAPADSGRQPAHVRR
jgi:geranylgeranyl reductase family protein